jgi:hypothetical protein
VLIRPPVVSEQPRRRAEGTLLKYIAGDGDRLPDLVATISELRHCPTFAAPGAVVVLECPSRVIFDRSNRFCLPVDFWPQKRT